MAAVLAACTQAGHSHTVGLGLSPGAGVATSAADPVRGGPPAGNFCLPTVADGRVFAGTTGELIIYGLLGS